MPYQHASERERERVREMKKEREREREKKLGDLWAGCYIFLFIPLTCTKNYALL
jgi:hypothetical protein